MIKRLFLLFCLSIPLLFFSCKITKIPEPETKAEVLVQEPMLLSVDETEFWKEIILIEIDRPGMIHADRTAQFADEIIRELRKRKK
jgi:hypothetical protein